MNSVAASAEVEAFITNAVNNASYAAANITAPAPVSVPAPTASVASSGPIVHGLMSAAYHDHAGPIYVRVTPSTDGTGLVEFVNTKGVPMSIRVELDNLEMGPRVEADYNNGRVEEKRYRFFLIMVDDAWRNCQVDKVTRSGSGFNVSFRYRGSDSSVGMAMTTFIRKSIRVEKLDFMVGLGEGADISMAEMRCVLTNTISREDARMQCEDDERLVVRSPMGLRTYVVMNQAWERPASTPLPLLQDMEASLQLSVDDAMERPADTMPAAAAASAPRTPEHQLEVTPQDMDDMMGTDTAAGKHTNALNPQLHEERGESSRWARKNEYQPPVGYLLRNSFIFDPRAEFTLRGTTPGERLDSIMAAELSKTPGFNIGHADLLFGFAFALQPLGTSFLGDIGSGTVRTVIEANMNKAVVSAHNKNDTKLTSLNMLVHVTLFLARTFARWYQRELADMAVFMDQFMRGAILIEGAHPAQCIVDGYVILLESALAGLGRDLGDMTALTYDSMIRAACDRFKSMVDMSSQQFAYSVVCARRIAASAHEAPMRGPRSPERGPPKRQDRGGRQRGNMNNSNNNNGPAHAGRIPAYVISALRDASGRTICGNFAIRNACRLQNCRYLHAPVPSNLPVEVATWIKNNAPVKSRQ